MTKDNELQPIQPEELEELDLDSIAEVAGGVDKEEAMRRCPRMPGKTHTFVKYNQDFKYMYYRCQVCGAEVKKEPQKPGDPDWEVNPFILVRPGR